MERSRRRKAWFAVAALLALLAAFGLWGSTLTSASRTCAAGQSEVSARGPYRKGLFVGEWSACDLTLRERGFRGVGSGRTETVGGGACSLTCEALVQSAGGQVLVDDTWYSRDEGVTYARVRDLVPATLLGGQLCARFDFAGDALRVRSWATCADAMADPPTRAFVSRDGGRSWQRE
jgi:hypothetical protein